MKEVMENFIREFNIQEINEFDIESLIVKKLADSNIIGENKEKKGQQTHIAITGEERNMFPLVSSVKYFQEGEGPKFYDINLPVIFLSSNLKKLGYKGIEEVKTLRTNVICYIGVRKGEAIQVQLSKLNSDGEEFIKFRKLLFKDDYLIVLKIKEKLEYIFLGLKKGDQSIIDRIFKEKRYFSKNTRSITKIETSEILISKDNVEKNDYDKKEKFINYLEKQEMSPATINNYTKRSINYLKNDLFIPNLVSRIDENDVLKKLIKKDFYFFKEFDKKEIKELLTLIKSNEFLKKIDTDKLHNVCTSTFNKYIEFLNYYNKIEHNYLVFGAPGTGKSYLLEEKRKEYFHDDNFDRVTFYDGYTYGQFVGSYKPKVKIDKDKKEEIITYEYIPGPFMKMLVKALKNSNEKYLILIEELNRAKADSVFGDIFQLLDRDKDGESKYRIAISEDQEAYLKEQGLGGIEKLYIPNNLYIWATMNSADQGVYPLDTAFKRRWSYEYLTLNENEKYFGSINGEKENKYENYKINIGDEKRIEWNKFRKKINEIVSEGNASEDRMLAPFFLVPEDFKEINGEETFILNDEVHKFKLLSYIFDDLLMYDKKSKSKIFKSEIKSFSELIETFNENINGVYNDDFIKIIVDTEQPEKTEEDK